MVMIEHPKFGDICMCECHQDGNMLMHIDGCCSLTYQKYINEDETLDEHRLYVLRRGDKLFPRKRNKRKEGQR